MSRWAWLLAVVLAYLGLELWLFDSAFIFHGDHERDLRYATLWVGSGVWPESSPSISPLPFELGPLLYFFLAPAVAISPDPFAVRVWLLVLASVGVTLFGWLLAGRMRWEAAVFGVFGLVSSTFAYELSRQLWHSSLLILPTAGLLFATTRMLEDDARARRWGLLAAGLAAVCLQLHMAATTFVAVVAGAALLRRKVLGARGLGLGVLVFVLCWLPMLVGIIQGINGGALDTMGRHSGRWSPVLPLAFFVDNVHTIWGDNLGPLLTWPWVALIGLGAGRAVAQKGPLPRVLLAVLLLGFVVEGLLLGNQPRAHRYMHANLMAAFGLGAWGLDLALIRIPKLRWALPLIGLVVFVEAVVSEVPHAGERGWMNAREQRAVAGLIRNMGSLSDEGAEQRIHGIFFGDTQGMGHLWAIEEPPVPAGAVLADDAHILVMPSDLGLHPTGERAGPVYTVKGEARDVSVYSYRPVIDYARLERPDALNQRWRRRAGFEGASAWLRVPVQSPAELHVAWLGSRGGRDRCAFSARLGSTPLKAVPIETRGYEPMRVARITVPHAGLLEVQLKGCRSVTQLDVW